MAFTRIDLETWERRVTTMFCNLLPQYDRGYGTVSGCEGCQGKTGATEKLLLYFLCAMVGFYRVFSLHGERNTDAVSDYYLWKNKERGWPGDAAVLYQYCPCSGGWISHSLLFK